MGRWYSARTRPDDSCTLACFQTRPSRLDPGLLWKNRTESNAGNGIWHIRSNPILAAHWPYQVVNKMLSNWIWYVYWVNYSCMQHHVHQSESPPLCWGRFHSIFYSVEVLGGLLTIQLFVVVLSQAPLTLVTKSSKIWCRQLAQTNNPMKQQQKHDRHHKCTAARLERTVNTRLGQTACMVPTHPTWECNGTM